MINDALSSSKVISYWLNISPLLINIHLFKFNVLTIMNCICFDVWAEGRDEIDSEVWCMHTAIFNRYALRLWS